MITISNKILKNHGKPFIVAEAVVNYNGGYSYGY
jgi:sialic acid synthase SpsE